MEDVSEYEGDAIMSWMDKRGDGRGLSGRGGLGGGGIREDDEGDIGNIGMLNELLRYC